MKSHSDVIEAFGGTRSLAEAIAIEPKRAVHWKARGIPAKYWVAVEKAASGHSVFVTAEMLSTLPRAEGVV